MDTGKTQKFLDWLISMDDPDDENGRIERQAVTLTKIIEKAREAAEQENKWN